MYKVTFQFEDKTIEPQVYEALAGETVLEIAMENDVELHHNCGGVCACTTCHIYVNNGMDNLKELSDREEDYIDRAINPKLNSRLACQCEIINGDVTVTVPDQGQYLGH
ncbi:MAG: 2Fe-2S iron-sulfur cluster binding domain-containing protein [Bacteroidetes bacterium]|nr:2Fe-2S iron-sulfur cluster binding domain-containing protein [Bacteroidota bacterium]